MGQKSIITLPEAMETYRRDDQVILFNLSNMTHCRIHEADYRLLVETLVGNELKSVISSVDEEIKERVLGLIFHLNNSGFLRNTQPSSESEEISSPSISTLYISLTRECNLRCSYCYADGGEKDPQSMNDERILSLIEEASDLGVEKITFTGGEPLVCKEVFTFAKKVKELGLELELITNGTLFHGGIVEELKLFDLIVVTLDGSTAEIHEYTRGEGTYYRTLRGISFLREHGIQVNVNTIINKKNYQDIYNTIDLVGRMGIQQHNTNVHIPMGRGESDGLECSEEEIRCGRFQLGEALAENMDREYILNRIYNSFPIPYISRKGCGAATTEMYVNYDGTLYPCRLLQFSAYAAGNVKESSLEELMKNSEVLAKCRRLYKIEIEACNDCSILKYCRGGCRAMHYLYSGDPFVNSQRICSIVKEDLEIILWLKSGYLPTYYYKGGSKW